jgi:hypothetical protein
MSSAGELEKGQTQQAGAAPVSDKSSVKSKSSTEPYAIDPAAERRLVWKCDLFVVPILFAVYLLSFLDRINIGNAKIQGLQTDLKLNGTQYNVALLIFFVPYILLEVPSNIILRKIAPSTWLSALLFFWGELLQIVSS